ncbi:MAG: long-chain fatty acid transporter [Gammaproteobacteria bacterium]|nr:MAG: long-chain fatty acid transporter [Gammaproteobacteria bacterium]
MTVKKSLVLAAAVAAAVAAPGAFATNGYFTHGYGIKAQGMAGAGVALPQDSLAAATNPAGMALVGNRIDVGVSLFRPDRATAITGNSEAFGATNIDHDPNRDESFFIPEFGYNKMISNTMSFGVSVYGNGGMNTSYSRNIAPFSTTQPSGIDFSQLFIAPTVAWKLSDTNSVGVSLNLAYQKMLVYGLQNFDSATQSNSPGNVTNKGYDTATGLGARIGWTGQITPSLALGATYQSKTKMSKFAKYKGLFAEDGGFDIPSNYAVGLAFKASPKTVVAFDVEKINYTDVKSVSNPLGPVTGGVGTGVLTNTLGTSNGAGFGWEDMTVYKLGVSHQWNDKLTVRAGWNHGKQPIPAKETFFNLLAPGVVEDHLTLGASWNINKDMEMSANYMHAFSKEVKGSGSIPSQFGGGEANLRMEQDSIGIAFGWKM